MQLYDWVDVTLGVTILWKQSNMLFLTSETYETSTINFSIADVMVCSTVTLLLKF